MLGCAGCFKDCQDQDQPRGDERLIGLDHLIGA